MFTAIISLIGSVFGGASKSAAAQLDLANKDINANVNIERSKQINDIKILNLFNYALFAAIALVLVILIVVIIKK